MAKHPVKWTLESLVDFEQLSSSAGPVSQRVKLAVAAATAGQPAAAARRVGLRIWLDEVGGATAGKKWTAALALVSGGLCLVMLLAGISAVLGLLDRDRGGIHVTLFLLILIGGQWLVLGSGLVAWWLRGRTGEGFSAVQALAGKLARRVAGGDDDAWWGRLMESGRTARAAVLWRLAGMAQAAGIAFNLGILGGLAGLVLVRHVGFFWETTTDLAMHAVLEQVVRFLSAPWAVWWPGAVPSAGVIESSRWMPGRGAGLGPGPAEWWLFLLAATSVWGLLPRVVLFLLSHDAGRRALANLDFQGRHHRALWREISGVDRVELDDKPLDGVLVLDVGGSGMSEQGLRPFMLQKLRVHPAAWKAVAVLDPGAEDEAMQALAAAPAGVVLLGEGWSLSPARMLAIHQKVRSSAGPEVPVKFLVANATAAGQPTAVTADERVEWLRFVDGLRDPAAEVFFYDSAHLAL
jgi:hypothetical protein